MFDYDKFIGDYESIEEQFYTDDICEYKTCTRCKVPKPLTEYFKKNELYFSASCKKCDGIQSRKHAIKRANNKPEAFEKSRKKAISNYRKKYYTDEKVRARNMLCGCRNRARKKIYPLI